MTLAKAKTRILDLSNKKIMKSKPLQYIALIFMHRAPMMTPFGSNFGIELNLHAVGMSALRFQALKGPDVAETLVTRTWDSTVNSQFDVKTLPAILHMSPGERGCAASHAHLWQQVASLPLDSPPLLVSRPARPHDLLPTPANARMIQPLFLFSLT